MNRTLSVLVSLLIVGTALVLIFDPFDRDAAAGSGALAPDDSEPAAETAGAELAESEVRVEPSREDAVIPDDAPPTPVEPAAVAPEPEVPAEVADLKAHSPLAIRVVDSGGFPVEGADVVVMGTRTTDSAMSYRGEMPEAITDGQGRAELPVWTWSTRDDRTLAVTLAIEHRDFVPFIDHRFPLGEDEQEVLLMRGGSLVVSGWIGDSAGRVTELGIELDDSANLSEGDWERLADGRPVTRRLEPGPHRIRLGHVDDEGRRYFSEVHAFEAPEAVEQVLHLELLPAERLVGQIDPAVPRPIEGGVAMLFLVAGALEATNTTLGTGYEAQVEPDGSFVFEDLPQGSGQWFASIPGWYSKSIRIESLGEVGITLEDPADPQQEAEAWEDLGERAFALPRVSVPQAETPAVLEMEPSGTLEVTLTGPDGEPLPNARIVAWPNYRIRGWGSSIVPGNDWQARADAAGLAVLEGLPPEGNLAFGVSAPGYRLPLRDGHRSASTKVRSGEVARVSLQLELDEE